MSTIPTTNGTVEPIGQPGFSIDEVTAYLFKKHLLRTSTSSKLNYYEEQVSKPCIFRKYLANNKIPDAPPTDFIVLTDAQIATQFGIDIAEIDQYRTTVESTDVFSIEQSTEYPYIYRINHCLLSPYPSNPENTFSAISHVSKVNLLQSVVPFSYADGAYAGSIVRTTNTHELSMKGMDYVQPHQLPYIFDYETGIFTKYDVDPVDCSANGITVDTPPAVTCYVYRGSFGRLGWSFINGAVVLDEDHVLMGLNEIRDPARIMDVSGTAFIKHIITNSLITTSDLRLKDNIRVLPLLKGILNLEPRTYNYRSDPDVVEVGLIAQEVETIAPQLVKENGGFKALQYDRIPVLLLPIIKDQESRIARLERENNELKALMSSLIRKFG